MDAGPLLAESTGVVVGSALVLYLPRLDRSRSKAVIRAISVISAVGAGLAGSSPSGARPVDIFLRAGFGAGSVLLGARAGSTALLLAAVAGVVGTAGSPMVWAALGTAGFMVAAVAGSRRSPVIKALAACALAQVVLRLDN